MKKIILSTLACCFLFSLVFSQTGDGDTKPELGTIINGNGLRPPDEIFYPNCEEDIPFTILVANLDLLDENSGQPTNYTLPIDCPPMGLQINIPNQNINSYYSIPNNSFTYSYTTLTGIQIFESTVYVPVDFSESCENGDGYPFTTDWDATLFVDSPIPTTLYPICEFTEIGDIFACDAFDYEEPCPIAPDDCSNRDYAQYAAQFNINCYACCEILGCDIHCSDDIFSIATFCDFNDDAPCDPCTGQITSNELTLCVVNQDNERIYNLGLNTTVGQWTVNGSNQPGAACITIPNFNPQLTYTISTTVTFYFQDGSTCTEDISATVGGCPSFRLLDDSNTEDFSLDIFPNPVEKDLRIINKNDMQLFIHLVSTDGKVVIKSSIPAYGNKSLNVQNLPVGIYHVQFKSVNGKVVHNERIVVTK